MSPDDYYTGLSGSYSNAHADAVAGLLDRFSGRLSGRVLDLGCGRGLATSVLSRLGMRDFVGADRSPEMVRRYSAETGFPAWEANFWDPLPRADSAVVVHALHLYPRSRVWELRWRLSEAGVRSLIVVSPLKRAASGLGMTDVARATSPSGDGLKTVYGWAFEV